MKSVSQAKLTYFEGIFKLWTYDQQELLFFQMFIIFANQNLAVLCVKRILFFLEFLMFYEVYSEKKSKHICNRKTLIEHPVYRSPTSCSVGSGRRQRNLSGSMKVTSGRKAPTGNMMPRRSSLGILPGAIGIGSGVVMDYPVSGSPVTNKGKYRSHQYYESKVLHESPDVQHPSVH